MSEDDLPEEQQSPRGEKQVKPAAPEATSGEPTPEAPSGAEPAPSLAAALEPPPEVGAAEAYEKRARLAEDRLAEVLAAFRKYKADNEGYRDRTAKNLERRYEQRRERLLLKFIEILDNLDRALEAAEQTRAGDALVHGLILVRTQLLQTLQVEGLERIPVLGLPYDPHVSEAVETRTVDDPDQHQIVVKDLLRGYRLMGRVARASRVVVGEYRHFAKAPPTTTEAGKEEEPAEKVAFEAVDGERTEPKTEDAGSTLEPPPSDSEEPSLEEIVAKAEAQRALFPGAFGEGEDEKDDEE